MPIGSELVIARLQASNPRFSDNLLRPPRGSDYGEPMVQNVLNGPYALCNEGSYFVATNPTVGTGISFAGAAVVSFTDTTGVGLVIQNTDVVGGATSKRIYLDYIRLITVTIGAAATGQHFWGSIDNVLTRYTSGGTTLTPTNPNTDASVKSVAKPIFGALTCVALSSGGRLTQRFAGKGGVGLIGDEIFIKFGGVEGGSGGVSSQVTLTPSKIVIAASPHVVAPGCTYALGQWAASQSAAPVLEFEMGWWER